MKLRIDGLCSIFLIWEYKQWAHIYYSDATDPTPNTANDPGSLVYGWYEMTYRKTPLINFKTVYGMWLSPYDTASIRPQTVNVQVQVHNNGFVVYMATMVESEAADMNGFLLVLHT